jgi:S-sulfo-L-cysteine synthase (3-phospho-L-serine-dependent)
MACFSLFYASYYISMNNGYIYVVGQADTHDTVSTAIRSLGYKVGILLDTSLSLSDPSSFDRVEKVDFSQIDSELERLATLDLNIAGLQCTYENYVVAKAKIGTYFGLASPSVFSAQLSTNKALMRQAFIEYDSTISPSYERITTLEAALEFAANHGYPVMIKPTSLVKSLLVLKCDSEADLREKFAFAQSTITDLYTQYNIYERETELIIEEFIVGKQFSIAAFIDAEGTPHFCDGIVALKNAQDIGVDDNYLYSRTLPATLTPEISAEMFEVARKGVAALQMRSIPAHIELMHGPSGVKIIEIGARIGGYRPRMYDITYGVDLVTQELKLALGQPPELKGEFRSYSAVYELFPPTEGPFLSVEGEVPAEELFYYRITATEGKIVGPAKNGYKASAIIIVSSNNLTQFESLCQKVESLEIKVASI